MEGASGIAESAISSMNTDTKNPSKMEVCHYYRSHSRKRRRTHSAVAGDYEDVVKLSLVAKKIARLNDERNRLIREINQAYGIDPGEEKIYS